MMPTNNANQNSIFRANALRNMNTIDQAFDLFKVVGFSSWLWLIFSIAFITALVSFGIFGNIAITVNGKGIILSENGKPLSIYSTYQGNVVAVLVKQGALVKQGEILARIYNPYIDEDLKFIKAAYEEHEQQFDRFKIQYFALIRDLHIKFRQAEKNINEKMKHTQERTMILNSLYIKKNHLYKKHYLTIIDMEKAREEYLSAKEELQITKQNLYDNKLKFKDDLSILEEKMKKYYMAYMEAKHTLDLKMLEKNNGSTIVCSEDGIVNNVNITEGDHIMAGKQLFTIISKHNSECLEALVFVNHTDGKKINVGMNVYVLPNEFSAYDYGYIKGKVVDVSEYPASRDSVNTYLGNMSLVDEYFSGGVPYMVKVSLANNNKSKSGLFWTTKSGAPFKIKPGATITAKITTKKSSPMNIMFKNLIHVADNEYN